MRARHLAVAPWLYLRLSAHLPLAPRAPLPLSARRRRRRRRAHARSRHALSSWVRQLHYPFENKEYFEKTFPADFIAEGIDQTRGWFYTLTVLAAALFDKPAFKNLICNGLVLAEV